jgi:hypothetical protein
MRFSAAAQAAGSQFFGNGPCRLCLGTCYSSLDFSLDGDSASGYICAWSITWPTGSSWLPSGLQLV